ncbi:MAG: hypothetical protein BWX54_01083 [Verrucomicrobia bacterium ADurb.Bin018]|nr:MAG: hypothetical protein BWX54_01083 [Verrucomicrobia bacterium ADurb.Bin018]
MVPGVGGSHFGLDRGDGFAGGGQHSEEGQLDVAVAVHDFAVLGQVAAEVINADEEGIAGGQRHGRIGLLRARRGRERGEARQQQQREQAGGFHWRKAGGYSAGGGVESWKRVATKFCSNEA